MPVVDSVAVSGIRQIQGDLKRIRRTAYRISSSRSTRTVVSEARRLAPVRTGKLRKHIRRAGSGRVVADPLRQSGKVTTGPSARRARVPGDSYASFVHYGGAAGGQGRGRQRAQPFFEQAVRNKRQQIADELDDALQYVIDKQTRFRQRSALTAGAAAAIRRRR